MLRNIGRDRQHGAANLRHQVAVISTGADHDVPRPHPAVTRRNHMRTAGPADGEHSGTFMQDGAVLFGIGRDRAHQPQRVHVETGAELKALEIAGTAGERAHFLRLQDGGLRAELLLLSFSIGLEAVSIRRAQHQ
jgi:hypothetical protein